MLGSLLCACGPGLMSRFMGRRKSYHQGGLEVPALLIGALLGYGLAVAVNSPKGRRMMSSINTQLGQTPANNKEKEIKDASYPSDEGKSGA